MFTVGMGIGGGVDGFQTAAVIGGLKLVSVVVWVFFNIFLYKVAPG